MNVNDEYDKQFLNQYQTLFLSDKLTNGTPGEKADVYRRLMGQLQLARNHGRYNTIIHPFTCSQDKFYSKVFQIYSSMLTVIRAFPLYSR